MRHIANSTDLGKSVDHVIVLNRRLVTTASDDIMPNEKDACTSLLPAIVDKSVHVRSTCEKTLPVTSDTGIEVRTQILSYDSQQ